MIREYKETGDADLIERIETLGTDPGIVLKSCETGNKADRNCLEVE